MNDAATPIIVPEEPEADTLRVPVLKVFDGDGFLTKLRNHRRNVEFEVGVRFGFVDAPEIGQQGGIEARDFLNSLIGGCHVDLSILYKSDTGQIVDRHNRIVCVPYLTAAKPLENNAPSSGLRSLIEAFWERSYMTRNIELEMVVNGWAWVLERYGPDERYMDAFSDAQRHRRGIWALDDNIPPWQFKHQQYQKRRPVKKQSPQPTLFSSSLTRSNCPQEGCGGHLVERSGRYGAFLGCSNFPKCKFTRSQ
ncbi:topoisomerase DNA-binding C4 zinc finger domain-containing protein [Sphingorhabdus sp.]|uniref:topoisomerase DNA-binding C4 zinc finger domain-containing protein n=1 Tax=Sphingorhabdus sp. TaxID=1902408 RepID=UPI0035B2CD71